MTSHARRRAEQIAPYAAGALLALPALVSHYPPMTDLPLHEAAVGLLRHWGDPQYVPVGVYQLNFGHPNQLFYFLIWGLSYVVGLNAAVRIVVAAAIFLLPIAAARFAKHTGSTRWSALLVAPLALGWTFSWGLLANLWGLSALLWALPILDRYVACPTFRGACASILTMAALYFTHELVMVVAAALMAFFAALRFSGVRRLALCGVPSAFALSLTLLQSRVQESLRVATNHTLVAWPTVAEKFRLLPSIAFGEYETPMPELLFVLAAVPCGILAWERWRMKTAHDPTMGDLPTWRARLVRARFVLSAAALFVMYLALPESTSTGATRIFERFLPLAYVVGVVASAAAHAESRIVAALSSLVPLGSLALAWPNFADSSTVMRDFDALVSHLQPGNAVAMVEVWPGSPARTFRVGTYVGHAIAERGGRSLFDFTQSPISPVLLKPEMNWNDVVRRLRNDSRDFRPGADLRRFRYLIIHARDERRGAIAASVISPDGHLAAQRGEFWLVESNILDAPPNARDVRVKKPAPPTLRELMDARIAEMGR